MFRYLLLLATLSNITNLGATITPPKKDPSILDLSGLRNNLPRIKQDKKTLPLSPQNQEEVDEVLDALPNFYIEVSKQSLELKKKIQAVLDKKQLLLENPKLADDCQKLVDVLTIQSKLYEGVKGFDEKAAQKIFPDFYRSTLKAKFIVHDYISKIQQEISDTVLVKNKDRIVEIFKVMKANENLTEKDLKDLGAFSESGWSDGTHLLSSIYEKGSFGVSKDPDRSKKLLLQAARMGHAVSMRQLALNELAIVVELSEMNKKAEGGIPDGIIYFWHLSLRGDEDMLRLLKNEKYQKIISNLYPEFKIIIDGGKFLKE